MREDLHGPPSRHHPAVGGESELAVKTRGVDCAGWEAVVVVGVDAEDRVIGIQQRRRLVEVAVEERKTSITGSRRKGQEGRCNEGGGDGCKGKDCYSEGEVSTVGKKRELQEENN